MTTRRAPIVCPPCGKPGTLHGPAITLKFTPKKPTPLTTGVAINETAWKNAAGEDVDCTICADPMSADSTENPWTGPGLFLTQACVNGHVYHKGCLLTHMSRSNNINAATCPECRNPILSEVAASLRRNGAPAPVPPPLNSGGGGLFGGGGGAGFGGRGGGLFGSGNAPAPAPGRFEAPPEVVRQAEEAVRQERRTLNNNDAASLWDRIHGSGAFANLPPPPPMERAPTVSGDGAAWWRGEISREEAERQSQARLDAERRRLENEAARVARLPYRSLEPLPPMTGINGHFFLVGGLDRNPTPLEIKEGLRARARSAGDEHDPLNNADKLHIRMSEQNLDPFHNPPHGMKVTLVQYEFNGLTDQEGQDFLEYYQYQVHLSPMMGAGAFYKWYFDLPTEPIEGVNGAPKWGEDPSGLPPTLRNLGANGYDAWASDMAEERREWEAQRAERGRPSEGPRTRARAAAEEREQLDEF